LGSISGMVRAVFLDALGTLVELEPPWLSLRDRIPAEVSDERLVRAVRAEMVYYREHAIEGRDESSLADLRERCARVISDELGVELSATELVEAIHFQAYADAGPTLNALGERGLRRIAVSNWDYSLGRVLERCGLARLLDGTVTSAEVGAPKPDPMIFAAALKLAGCAPEEAVHVGDTPEEDVSGARDAGIRPLLIDRDGGNGDIASLAEIEEHL
jgi:putative hydrolase of the HAD superfamily